MVEIQDTPDKAIEDMLDEIQFGWCIGGDSLMNPKRCIPIERVLTIMARHIPQIDNYFKAKGNVDESV